MKEKAKYILHLKKLKNGKLVTECIWNKGKLLGDNFIFERGLKDFLNKEDVEETSNWNLNGNRDKGRFFWLSDSRAVYYVFD